MGTVKTVRSIYLALMLCFAAASPVWAGDLESAIAAHNEGRLEPALEIYDRLIATGSLEKLALATVYNNRGSLLDDLGQTERAIGDFDQALLLAPGSAEVLNNRGVAYGKLGLYDRALLDFELAIRARPRDPDLYSNRGVAFGKKGLYERAIRDFNRALSFLPNDAATLFNRGLAYIEAGQEDRGLADLAKARALMPENPLIAAKAKELGIDD